MRLFPEPLFRWMSERHAIHERKARGDPKPWTDDPILRRYKFCNVFRELDRTTVWVRERVREPMADHPDLWLAVAMARAVNWPPTVEEWMATPGAWPGTGPVDPRVVADVIESRADRGERIVTGAHLVHFPGTSSPEHFAMGPARYLGEVTIGGLVEAADRLGPALETVGTLAGAHAILSRERGWGPFTAYEVVTDLRHTRILRDAADVMTWANVGPGSARGLERLTVPDGRLPSPRSPLRRAEALDAILDLTALAPSRLPAGFPPVEPRDVEHSLCETDKWLRAVHGEGRPKATYDGG